MIRLACSCSKNVCTSARIFPCGASMNWVSSFCTISARVRCPSQSSRMIRPVPSTRIVPSGKSTTGASAVPPHRHPEANFGTLASISSATFPLIFPFDAKSPRRRPPRLDIGEIERVELRPQDVALVAQGGDHALLICARGGMIEGVLNREGRILRSLRQSRFEVVEAGRKPGIVMAQFLHAQRDQVARKKLGQ